MNNQCALMSAQDSSWLGVLSLINVKTSPKATDELHHLRSKESRQDL